MIRQQLPDLIVLDIRMEQPESGWNLLKLLRLDRQTRHIPIIVASADVDFLRQKEQQLKVHTVAILVKPFSIEDLLAKVEAAVDLASSANMVGG